jgi:hypothetical protein
MKKQIIEVRFLSDRFLKWVKVNFNLSSMSLAKSPRLCLPQSCGAVQVGSTTPYALYIVVLMMCISMTNVVAQPKICTDIRKVLIQRQQGHEPKDFYIEYREQDGGDSYQGLDIDGDKINDSIVRICGFSIDAICGLEVNLSGGKSFDLTLEGEKFFLGRIKASIYVIVGETSDKEKEKHGKRRIYQVTKQAVKLICSHL